MSIYRGYQGAKGCTGGPQPGARALMAWWLETYGPQGAVNTGIYNCRQVRGGGSHSLHAEGRAGDLGVRPHDAQYGHEVAQLLHDMSAEMGVQCIIWSGRIWSGSYWAEGFRPYRGASPHYDHLHVELAWHVARIITKASIIATLAGHAASVVAAVAPAVAAGGRLLHLTRPEWMRGQDVRELQHVLRRWYPRFDVQVDGVFGPQTDRVVRHLQRNAGITVDGRVGPQTRRVLGMT